MLTGKAKEIKISWRSYIHIHSADITKWTKRWIDRAQDTVLERLSDLPRPGAPDTFTPEQICQMVAMVCENPETYGHPISHWSQDELADEMIKQGIVNCLYGLFSLDEMEKAIRKGALERKK